MKTIPVIIDCDPGIDDVMALLLAFTSPELDIKLITTVSGNQTQDKTAYNARSFLTYINQAVEVARGLEQPLFRKLEVAADVHGENGLGDVIFPEPSFEESSRTAINALYDTIMKSSEPIVLIATGPLTNIGALFLAHPEVKSNIRYISFMGGAAVGGNMTPTAEFNVYVDPHAADIVFHSGIPIVMSGLDVTHKAFLNEEDLNRIDELGTELSERLVALMKFYRSNAKQTSFHEENFETNIRLHDLCAVSYVVDPTLFEGDDCYVAIETQGELTMGTTVVDYTQSLPNPKNVKVLHTVKREKLVGRFIDAIQKVEKLIEGGNQYVSKN